MLTEVFCKIILLVTLCTHGAVFHEVTTKSLEKAVDGALETFVHKLLPLATELASEVDLSPACSSSLLQLMLGLRRKEPWALRLISSNGLLTNSMFEYNIASVGGYEQCLRTEARDPGQSVKFRGLYCSLHLRIPKPFSKSLVQSFSAIGEMTGRLNLSALPDTVRSRDVAFRFSLCAPSTCRQHELHSLVAAAVSSYGVNTTVRSCRTNEPKSLDKPQLVSLTILGTLTLFVVIGTFTDVVLVWRMEENRIRKPGAPIRALLAFSAITNTRRLLNTQCRPGNEPLRFVNGLKTLMCAWVILGHTYLVMQVDLFHSIRKLLELMDKVHFQIIVNSPLSVTTFFFLSGFLMAYIMMAKQEIARKKSPLVLYAMAGFRRYTRLVFPAMVMVLVAFVLPLFVDGPADDDFFADQTKGCYKNWWTAMTLSLNFNGVSETCLQHLWYICVDMQIMMFFVLPLMLLMIYHPRTALLIGIVASLGCSALTVYQTYVWNLLFSLTTGTIDMGNVMDTVEYIYFRPVTHLSSYVSGVLCGYVTFRYKHAQVPTIIQALFWISSVTLSSFVIFVTTPWNRGQLPGPWINALYAGLHRLVWTFPLWWLHFACANGHAG
ncbi:unnamed protein product, partial [Ixodes persulcatus]